MRPIRSIASLTATAGLMGSFLLGSAAPASATVWSGSAHGAAAAQATREAAAGNVEEGRAKPQPSTRATTGAGPSASSTVCQDLVPPPYAYADRSKYVCGDWRIGPKRLPTKGVLGNVLDGYDRLGGLTPAKFLHKWWNPAGDQGQGSWRYPDDDGFEHDSEGDPIAAPLTLRAGQKLDRFGSEAGQFLAPAGVPYGERSLPPSNLNTADAHFPFNYHLYRVAREVKVCAGPISPAFEQPGNGVQYVTKSYPSACRGVPTTNVAGLVSDGTLVRLN